MTVWLAACGSSATTTSPATTTTLAGPGTTTASTAPPASMGGITIRNFSFSPNPLKAKVGDSVQVHNQDSTTHTFAADNGAFDTKDIAPSATATVKLTMAGTFVYHCHIHQFMSGTVNVS